MRPISEFLLGSGTPPGVDTLRAADLAAYAYTALPAGNTLRERLRPDFLAGLSRHHKIKRELIPLVAAWRDAGIETLLFKGFHLAEFVYPAPGARFHGDVDVAVRPHCAAEALRVAVDSGWRSGVAPLHRPAAYSHGVGNLYRDPGATQVDLQRFVIHSRSRRNAVQRRITEAVWRRAHRAVLGSVPVRVPDPLDALLILTLQRAWGDGWGTKVHDPLDIRFLTRRVGPGWREALERRAEDAGCSRTLRNFLDRCDPGRGRLVLDRPSPAERRRRDRAVFRERPFRLLSKDWEARARLLPGSPFAIAHALPWLFRAWTALRRHSDLPRLLESLTPRLVPRPRSPPRTRWKTVQGIRWALRLFPHDPRGSCLVRSLAIYAALRAQGWLVQFVSGVRRGAEGIVGHAWVEFEGRVLYELGEPHNPRLFAANFRYPEVATGAGAKAAAEYVPSAAAETQGVL